jgi:hypothetical protein
MAERERKERLRPVPAAAGAPVARSREADDAERALGRLVAVALPATCVLAAVIVGIVASIGSALLVVAAGALLGTIALLWASVRTLTGDAPLASDVGALVVHRHGVDALAEEKRRLLRALKDLESEHALGKIDDADYEAVQARYREQAKSILRQMDLQVAPLRQDAERIAREYLAKHALAADAAPAESAPAGGDASGAARVACTGCGTSNEADAAFCKRCGARVEAKKPTAEADREA